MTKTPYTKQQRWVEELKRQNRRRVITYNELQNCPNKRIDPGHYTPYDYGCECTQRKVP